MLCSALIGEFGKCSKSYGWNQCQSPVHYLILSPKADDINPPVSPWAVRLSKAGIARTPRPLPPARDSRRAERAPLAQKGEGGEAGPREPSRDGTARHGTARTFRCPAGNMEKRNRDEQLGYSRQGWCTRRGLPEELAVVLPRVCVAWGACALGYSRGIIIEFG